MKRLAVSFIFLTAFVCVFVQTALALEWNFEGNDSAKDWQPVTGKWSVKEGEYSQDQRGIPAMRSFVGDPSWTDYTVEARIKVTENSYVGLIFRAQSELEYHVFYMNVNGNVVEWWTHTKPNPDSRQNKFKHAGKNVNILLDKWYNFKVVANGDNFEFYINDELQDKGSDKTYPSGRIGLWAWDSKARFDDVKVTGKGIPESAAVFPSGKLSTVWGTIKAPY